MGVSKTYFATETTRRQETDQNVVAQYIHLNAGWIKVNFTVHVSQTNDDYDGDGHDERELY